jgi:hypothetical protein
VEIKYAGWQGKLFFGGLGAELEYCERDATFMEQESDGEARRTATDNGDSWWMGRHDTSVAA